MYLTGPITEKCSYFLMLFHVYCIPMGKTEIACAYFQINLCQHYK